MRHEDSCRYWAGKEAHSVLFFALFMLGMGRVEISEWCWILAGKPLQYGDSGELVQEAA